MPLCPSRVEERKGRPIDAKEGGCYLLIEIIQLVGVGRDAEYLVCSGEKGIVEHRG